MKQVVMGCLMVAGLTAALTGQVLGPDAAGASPAVPPYAGTPAELVPYRRGNPPFHRFFTEAQPYRGPHPAVDTGSAGQALRVGLLLPAPGSPDGPRGTMVRRGVELAFAEARATRAADAPGLELLVREDAPTWGSVATSFVELAARERVLAVIGSVDSAATHVALRVALKLGVLIVNTASSDPTVTETAIPWIQRCFPDDRQHGYALALQVVKARGCRRIVVLRVNDRYGRFGVKEFQDAVRRLGSPVLVEMRYEPGDREFATQVARLRAARPDAVVFWGDGEDLGHAARALREAGLQAPFFGPDRLVDPAFLRAAGRAAEGTTATYPFDPARPDPEWQSFRKRFRTRFDVEPDHFAAYAYDGARMLLTALDAVGADRVALRSAIAAISTYRGVSGTLRFDPTLNNVTPPILMKVVDGAFQAE